MFYRCNRCDANCDAGEIIGGICLDCAEDEQQRQIRSAQFARIDGSMAVQMRMEDLYE